MHQPDIKPGAIVRHPKFGVGKVAVRYGEDEKSKVIIKFQEEGEKKLSLSVAKLTVDKPVADEAAIANAAAIVASVIKQ